MAAPSQAYGQALTHRRHGFVDHVFISCLETRFTGTWHVDSALHCHADDNSDNCIVQLVELNGTRKTIGFKRGANVTLLPTNVLTYEKLDENESVYVDEDERSIKGANSTVLKQ